MEASLAVDRLEVPLAVGVAVGKLVAVRVAAGKLVAVAAVAMLLLFGFVLRIFHRRLRRLVILHHNCCM